MNERCSVQCVRENKKIHKYVLNMLHLHVTSKGVCIHGWKLFWKTTTKNHQCKLPFLPYLLFLCEVSALAAAVIKFCIVEMADVEVMDVMLAADTLIADVEAPDDTRTLVAGSINTRVVDLSPFNDEFWKKYKW